jgi:23S rRNA pseudouridine1911/1915/1917 synthase
VNCRPHSRVEGAGFPAQNSSQCLYKRFCVLQKKVRIDSFLSGNMPDVSRARLKASIQEGLVYVNRTTQTKPAYGCKVGDVIAGSLPEPPGTTAEPEDIPLLVAYEDDHVLVVNKAAGVIPLYI